MLEALEKAMRIPALAMAALALPAGASAAEPARQETFTTIFATTCMQYFFVPDELRRQMTTRGAPALAGEQARFFLGGKPGTAWAVRMDEDKYVVSWTDDGICAVFAQRAPVAEVQANFTTLVASAPAPMTASARANVGPNTAQRRSTSYAWHRPQDKTELLFTLTTSSEANPKVQAMASMGVVNKPVTASAAKPPGGAR